MGRLKCLATGLDAFLSSFSTSRRCSRNLSPSRLPVSPMYNVLQRVQNVTCKCNLFTHGAPRSSQELVQKCPCIPDRIGVWKCWFLRRGENRRTRRKTSRSRVENQQQTQPTYDAGSGNRTRVTLSGGERSHHLRQPCSPSASYTVDDIG